MGFSLKKCEHPSCDATFAPRGFAGYCSRKCYNAAYYAAHREEVVAQKAARRASNPEKLLAQCAVESCRKEVERRTPWQLYCSNRCQQAARRAAYTPAHRAEIAAKKGAYHATHREEIAARRAAHYAAHKAEMLAKAAAYYVAHKAEIDAYAAAYGAEHREERVAYMAASHAAKRAKCIEMLGGKCVRCGSTDELDFDHIDPATKSFNIASRLQARWDKLQPELDFCQLLCRPCHVEKTEAESGPAAAALLRVCPLGGARKEQQHAA